MGDLCRNIAQIETLEVEVLGLDRKQPGACIFIGVSLFGLVFAAAGRPLLAGTILLAGVLMIMQARTCSAHEHDRESLLRRLAELHSMEMAETIRIYKAQRHDYINHLQVIYGMLQTGKADQVPGYIAKASREISLEDQLDVLPAGEFRHILLASKIVARSHSIELDLHMRTDEPWTGFQDRLRERNLCFRMLILNLMQILSCTMDKDMKIVLEIFSKDDSDQIILAASPVNNLDKDSLFILPGVVKDLISHNESTTIETIWTQELGGTITLQKSADETLEIVLSAPRR